MSEEQPGSLTPQLEGQVPPQLSAVVPPHVADAQLGTQTQLPHGEREEPQSDDGSCSQASGQQTFRAVDPKRDPLPEPQSCPGGQSLSTLHAPDRLQYSPQGAPGYPQPRRSG